MINTTKKKISKILNDLKIEDGSYIIIHSSSFMFGRLEGGIETLYRSLKDNFGQNNTLIFPSFTYSYRRNQIFDILNTPCANQIGMLSEIARKDSLSYRNNDPLFSLVAIGYDKQIIERKSNSCFGSDSIYEKLFEKKLFILSLGVELTNGVSEFMHIEKLAKVPYRYNRIFKGSSISHKNLIYKDYANHFARNETVFKSYRQNREKFGDELIKKKIVKRIAYGYGKILLINGSNFLDYTLSRLQKNKHIMLEKI